MTPPGPGGHEHWYERQAVEPAPAALQALVAAGKPTAGLTTWIPTGNLATSALVRVPRYPARTTGTLPGELRLRVARGARANAQLALLSDVPLEGLQATATDPVYGGQVLDVTLSWVRYLPVIDVPGEAGWLRLEQTMARHEVSGNRLPDVIADALPPAAAVDVPALTAQPLWLTVQVPTDATPGNYHAMLQIYGRHGILLSRPLIIEVPAVTVPPRQERRFHLDVWFAPDAIATAHEVQPWSSAHWSLITAYLREQAAAGQRVIGTAVVANPWRHSFAYAASSSQTFTPHTSLVEWVWDGSTWTFNFERFGRLVESALAAGVGPAITAYSLLAFSGPERLVYLDLRDRELKDEEVVAGDPRWRLAWSSFLLAFQTYLVGRGWLEQTYLAFDERPRSQLGPALELIAEVAPAFSQRLHLAGTDQIVGLGRNSCVAWDDVGKVDEQQFRDRRTNGLTTTFYTYCVGEHPNCVTFSPAVESRMLPWLAASHGLDGYLRWAFNDWPPDVWCYPAHLFPQGDEYLVYPGTAGPMSSIRWELLQQGIEDVELFWAAQQLLGATAPALVRALHLATRNLDGRSKDPADLVLARRLVEDALAAVTAAPASGQPS